MELQRSALQMQVKAPMCLLHPLHIIFREVFCSLANKKTKCRAWRPWDTSQHPQQGPAITEELRISLQFALGFQLCIFFFAFFLFWKEIWAKIQPCKNWPFPRYKFSHDYFLKLQAYESKLLLWKLFIIASTNLSWIKTPLQQTKCEKK